MKLYCTEREREECTFIREVEIMTRLAELSEESKKCLEDPDSRCTFNSLSGLNLCKPVLVMFLYLSYVDHADDLYLTVSGPALEQPLKDFQSSLLFV